MPLKIILKWKKCLEKVCRICTEFTKIVHRICNLRYVHRIFNFLVQHSDNHIPDHLVDRSLLQKLKLGK